MSKPVRSRSIEARNAMLRSGAGKHGDKRTKRNRDRSAQKRNAVADQRQ